MKNPQQFIKILALVFASFGLMISYQNCSSENIKFSSIGTVLSSSKPDFKIIYTEELEVGNIGHFIATSEDAQIESAEWIFNDGETLDGAEGIRTFSSVGRVKFDVKVKFTGSKNWVTKNDLNVNVMGSDPDTCIDLNNMRIQSEQVDFSQEQPTWELNRNLPLRVGLNFNTCLAVHLYQVHWLVHTPTVPRGTMIYEHDGHVADIPFQEPGTYHIVAEVKRANDPQLYVVRTTVTVVENADGEGGHCKPKSYILTDKDVTKLYVGDTVNFVTATFSCMDHTGSVDWFVDGVKFASGKNAHYTFNAPTKGIEIRAVLHKSDNTRDEYFLTAIVSSKPADSGYHWTCGNCGKRCVDGNGNLATSTNLCGPDPGTFECPDVCNPEPIDK